MKVRLSRWVGYLVLVILGWGPLCSRGQQPEPVLEPGEKAGLLLNQFSKVGAPVPTNQVLGLERMLADLAKKDAKVVAASYARMDAKGLEGVQAFGLQLLDELAKKGSDFDFQGVVTRNPVFWTAEREVAATDMSLPYLVSMLSVLNHDYATAARIMALAQATLPLTPTVRRGYCRPESMMLYMDSLLLTGIPSSDRMQTPQQCEKGIAVLRERIATWSNRPGLMRALIELEVRRVELLTKDGENLGMLDEKISQRLELTPEDLAFARKNDPILAEGFDATVRQWLNKSTLAQRWSRWIENGDPAELPEVQASVAAYAAHGRPDLAWLTWRHEGALTSILPPEEQRRWQTWCNELLDAKSAAFVEHATAANPLRGMGSMPIEDEGFSEAWSGDQGINGLLAIRIERRIAMVDTMLALMPPGSSGEGNYRLKRAESLAQIDAVEPARRELRRVQEIIHNSEKIMAMPGVKVMELIKVVESRLLDTEGHYAAAEAMYRELLRNPRLREGIEINYQAHLMIAGNVADAHERFRNYALKNPADTYRSIKADLSARRVGQRETEILQAARRNARPEVWPADGVKFLLGTVDEAGILESARHGTLFEVADHQCEAFFWLGEVALAEGRNDDAIKWFSRCVATGFLSNIEYKVAKAELERLIPESDRKKKGPENSDGVITT